MRKRCVSVMVWGKVQGVGFRQATTEQAVSLGLAGWVKNSREHSDLVEAKVEGSSEHVERFLAWVAEGPRMASVRCVEVREGMAEGALGFAILH